MFGMPNVGLAFARANTFSPLLGTVTSRTVAKTLTSSLLLPSRRFSTNNKTQTLHYPSFSNQLYLSQLKQSSRVGSFNIQRHQRRFNSSSSNPKDDKSKNDKKKKQSSASEVWELLKLTKSELPTLTIALGLLCVSSAVSMLFPSIIGLVIDTVKDPETPEDETKKEQIAGIDIPSTIKKSW
ncbi:unnamed protein product [Ambrosiozyma monospora]|uniref:Unnamed protein product n=1 Tax=Ambrosiozyma monospora TaxID=43982 RepID=A0ACB5U1I2_AMBMO|nr:unnamed protein product [Ambrosiozyma monospora]